MQLNNMGFLLVSVLTFGLIGCSSSSPTTPAGTSTGTGGTDGNGTTDPNAGVGANPGFVPAPILAELTTINLQDLGGHIVYAGPTERFFEGYSYVNINFACDGTGTFELFPAVQFASFAPIVKGTSAWVVSSDGEDVDVEITQVTEGGGGATDFDADDISVNPASNDSGTLIVGSSTLQSKYVARIVQYEECL